MGKIIREQRVLYGKHQDITSTMARGKHNPEGRCTLQLSGLQQWSQHQDDHHLQYQRLCQGRLCSTLLQNHSRAWWAPTCLGLRDRFAPHWTMLEVFMMQLEGRKHWRLYEPDHKLPRSSKILSQDDWVPILEVDMEPEILIYRQGYNSSG